MGLSIPRPVEQFATQRAIIVDKNGKFIASSDAPCPSMQRDQFLVKTQAVAINPSDTKMLGDFQVKGGILGTDFAGAVIAVGEDVQGVRVGDRVAGAQNAMMAGSPECGAFGQFNVNAGRVWLRLPPTLGVEAGATLPAGTCTAGLVIRSLGLPLPPQIAASPATVLFYGGSTATGTVAIQLLKQAGLVPIATCSPHNFSLKQATGNNLAYALDCITTPESTQFCYTAIGRAGGRYVSLDPYSAQAASRKAIKGDWVLGPSIFGKGSSWPSPYGRPGSIELTIFASELFESCQMLLDQGLLRPHPLQVHQGTVDTILHGLEVVRQGNISGEKVIVSIL